MPNSSAYVGNVQPLSSFLIVAAYHLLIHNPEYEGTGFVMLQQPKEVGVTSIDST
jgi:hypothetical protein